MIFETDYSRTKRDGYLIGKRDTLDAMEQMFTQWAITHPNDVVRDELWQFVERIRREITDYEK